MVPCLVPLKRVWPGSGAGPHAFPFLTQSFGCATASDALRCSSGDPARGADVSRCGLPKAGDSRTAVRGVAFAVFGRRPVDDVTVCFVQGRERVAPYATAR